MLGESGHRMKSKLWYHKNKMYLRFKPHGYSHYIDLPVIKSGSREENNAWTWNGSEDAPTLKPSIKTLWPGGTISHLWLTDGICTFLPDSSDGCAGKILSLLELTENELPEEAGIE